MAALTWRNVDAPNFQGVQNGYRNSVEMLNNAFDSLGKGLGQVQENRTNAADSQALANALRVNDPAAYQQQLQGADLTGVSPETLGLLGSRSSDLLDQAAAGQRLDAGKYVLDRTKNIDADMDAARPAFAAMLAAGSDPASQAAVRQQYGPILAKLSGEQQLALASDMQGLEAGLLGNNAKRFSNKVTERNDGDQQSALAAVDRVSRGSASPDDARYGLSGEQGLTPAARLSASNQLGSLFGEPLLGPVGAPSGGGSPGTAQGNPFDITYGFGATQTPISTMKLGEIQNYQKTDLLPNKGASPVGAFQINKATLEDFGPKVLGEDWKNQTFTPEVQDKLAEAIFDSRKKGNLKATWAALPDDTVGAYANKPWSEMRQLIAKNEVGQQLPTTSAAAVSAARAQVGNRLMQNQSQGAAVDLAGNLANTDTPGAVAAKLIETDFPDADRGQITDKLSEIMREAGVNAAQAGSIMVRNPDRVGFFRSFLPNSWTGNLGGDFWGSGMGLNTEGVDAAIAEARSGQTSDQMLANASVQGVDAALAAAQQAQQSAQAQLQAVIQRARSQPELVQLIPRYRQQLAMSEAALTALVERQRSNPELQAREQEQQQPLPVMPVTRTTPYNMDLRHLSIR